MSGDENDMVGRKRKRKPGKVDSSASSSSTSSGSPFGSSSSNVRRRKLNVFRDSTESETSEESDVVVKRKKVGRVDTDSDFSSEDDSSPIIPRRRIFHARLNLNKPDDSDESDSSVSDVIVPRRLGNSIPLLLSEQEDESDQWLIGDDGSDSEPHCHYDHHLKEAGKGQCGPTEPNTSVLTEEKNIDSDSSEGNSEKCPICLISFRLQEVGIPENCEHKFCLECIEEWSKNMNTCPVDRKEYNSITVRKCLNGKVLREIPIQRPERQEDPIIIEDPTFCEICGSSDDEDRLLLCDGCDLGFHLYCLNPPLDEVPEGVWYCNLCGPEVNHTIDFDEVAALMDDADELLEGIPFELLHARRTSRRLVPRTRQSELVRRRVENNRNQRRQLQPQDENIPSTSNGRVSSTRVSSTTKKRRRKSRKRVSKRRYKTVWVLNELGEAVPVKKARVRKNRKKRKRTQTEKSVKRRLASQLGICASQQPLQFLPDVTISSVASLTQRRFQAGIPNLDIHGTMNRLDYFSPSEDEGISNENEVGGVHTLLARRPVNSTDVLRRISRRKAAVVNIPTVSSSTDILDSIMDSQEKFLSKNSVISVVDPSGKIIIEDKKLLNNNSPSKPDFNSYSVKETPWHGRNYNSGYRHNNRSNWSNNRNNWQQNNSNQNSYPQRQGANYFGQSGSNYREQQFQNDIPQDYTQRTLCEAELLHEDENDVKSENNTPEAEVDVYGDIENVSTSRVEEDYRPSTPPPAVQTSNTDDDNDSESGMVIDTDRGVDDPVSSTVGLDQPTYSPGQPTDSPDMSQYSPGDPTNSPGDGHLVEEARPEVIPEYDQVEELKSGFDELQKEFASGLKEFQMNINSANEGLSSGNNTDTDSLEESVENEVVKAREALVESQAELIVTPTEKAQDDDEDSNDGCPNFSIYSRQSKSVALTTDISLPPEPEDPITDESSSLPPINHSVTVEKTGSDPRLNKKHTSWNLGGLYSDSEDESVVKKTQTYGISDIKDMTEDIESEEERSYTPVLDEKPKEVFEGLDTELISDDDRNDFDESHNELKTASDGDALEINAKESEIEFTRPEDFEEGEIVDKNKEKVEQAPSPESTTPEKINKKDKDEEKEKRGEKDGKKKKKLEKEATVETGANKENVIKEASFKKLTKSNKERNYRDKDKTKESLRSRSKTPETSGKKEESKKKREKRKELERYNVRAIIAEKPRHPVKDQFGRDLRKSATKSRSRSYTPPLAEKPPAKCTPSPIRAPSPTPRKRSLSRGRTPPRGQSVILEQRSKSRDKGSKRKRRSRSRSRPRTKKRRRSASRSNRRKKSKEKGKKRRRSVSRTKRHQSRSVSPRRNRREWTPSLSRSITPPVHHASPSWTPPRSEDVLRNQNLTVIVNNETAKKKKEKRSKDKRRKDDSPSRRRRRERDRTPPPSKEVFASGDNILVSVSFNNENESRDVSTRESRKRKEASASEQQKKSKERRNKNKKDLSGVKPVAIIDLERSPFQEIVSSPKDVIVLSDSDNNETDTRHAESNVCDSSQQVASPEETPNYSMGPKTPPEPSVKFSLLPKPQQIRAINNPLHDPLEVVEEETQDDLNQHKGPNTPSEEPPTSPPSSPDAYDPFEPTKSPTPEPRGGDSGEQQNNQSTLDPEKGGQTPDIIKSLTPPMPDIQPADSQSSIQEISESKSPDLTTQPSGQQTLISKPVAQTVPFSPVQSTLASAVPVSTTVTISRVNILSSAMISPVKPNPVKIPPTKAAIKSLPVKPMESKSGKKKQQNGNSLDEVNLNFDSPYSPGSSDYDDLFEPPSEPASVTKSKSSKKGASSGKKASSAFDTLFGSPSFSKKTSKKGGSKKDGSGTKTKHVGVKVDEDNLKILEDMPNSAVEMQVKDKFLKKLNRQERVVEEVKLVLKPFYNKKKITKEEYKDIMRRAVPKICHNKTGEINPIKIRTLIEAYVKKIKHSKKVTSSSSLPQKVA